MSLHRVFDAAYPPKTVPPGCDAVLGYIGGHRATHVWTPDEWQPFHAIGQFPCYVPDFANESPLDAATAAVTGAMRLGWAAHMAPAVNRVIVCDLETLAVRAWYAEWARQVGIGGFTAVAYGSLSTVLENASADVWAAAWDGHIALVPGQTVHGHQFAANSWFAGTEIDLSGVDDWLYARAGRGARHGA